MEDIILVTGTHCTRSCTNVAFPGGQDDAQVSFGAKVDRSGDGVAITWQFSHEQNRGVVLNDGPEGEVWPYVACAGKWILMFVWILFALGPARRSVHFHTGVSRCSYVQDTAAEAQGGSRTQSRPRRI
jgi:hypothetical protein